MKKSAFHNDGDQIGIEVTEARENVDDNFQEEGLASANGYLDDEMEYCVINAVHRRIEKKISGLKTDHKSLSSCYIRQHRTDRC